MMKRTSNLPRGTASLSVDALFSVATEYLRSGQLSECVAICDRIISLNADLPEAHSSRGVALARLGSAREAEAAFRQAIVRDPDYAHAHNNLGIVLCELGRYEEAETVLRCAVGLKPECARCHLNLGNALRAHGRLTEAETVYRQAIALDSNIADLHNNLGIVLLDLGRAEQAETAFERAIALVPDYGEAFSNLGNALGAQGRLGEAEVAYRQAIAIKPEFAEAHNNLGNILVELGQIDAAERALRRAIALRPTFAEAFSNLGNVLKEKGQLDEAKSAYQRAIVLRPEDAKAHSNLGNVLRDEGELSAAEAAYRKAVALKPDFAIGFNNLGAVLRDSGRLADARQAVENATRLEPKNTLCLFNLGELKQFTLDDPALAAMQQLVDQRPSLPVKEQIWLHFALAKAYEDLEQFELAFRELLAGNALKRQLISYDEAATLGTMEAIRTALTPEVVSRFEGSGEPSPVPVFIVGMPRSGTTLIEQILASHPQVFGAGELPNLGRAVADIPSDNGRVLGPSEISRHLSRIGSRYVSEVSGLAPTVTHITDKMPSNFIFLGLIHLAMPNARIIHAVRDPLDTCVSCFSKLFAAGQAYSYELTELGRYYRCYQTLMQHWHRVLPPGRILDVNYESLVADLEGQARRMIAHCALPWDSQCLDFHRTNRPVRTASAAQVRRPLYASSVGRAQRYKTYLEPLYRALADSYCGASMHD